MTEKTEPTGTPGWMLERLARDELSPEAARALREKLGADVVEAQLEALRASDRDILAQHPPADVAREVRRRFETAAAYDKARAGAREPARRRAPWLAFPVAIGAAAMAMLVISKIGTHVPGGSVALDGENIGIKGLKPELRVYRK